MDSPDSPRNVCDSGLSPVPGNKPRVLVLGSFPSLKSLEQAQYYGNPKNHFWAIMEDLLSIDRTLPYSGRLLVLEEHHIALWDVVRSCCRHGSGDAKIRGPIFNDIQGFIDRNPGLRLIALNGSTARRYFDRLGVRDRITVVTLPSTSPAHARLTVREKMDRWRIICDYL